MHLTRWCTYLSGPISGLSIQWLRVRVPSASLSKSPVFPVKTGLFSFYFGPSFCFGYRIRYRIFLLLPFSVPFKQSPITCVSTCGRKPFGFAVVFFYSWRVQKWHDNQNRGSERTVGSGVSRSPESTTIWDATRKRHSKSSLY